ADLARYVRDFDPDEVVGPAGTAGPPADGDDRPFGGPDFPAPVAAAPDWADGEDDAEFDDYEDDDFDELSVEGLFLHVTAMWSVLGAIDSDDRLPPLGWWGLPEAMRRAWTES